MCILYVSYAALVRNKLINYGNMSASRQRQGGTGNIVKCFRAANVVSVDEVFMQYFQYNVMSSASGGFTPAPTGVPPPKPRWETFVPIPFNLLSPGKNPASAHVRKTAYLACVLNECYPEDAEHFLQPRRRTS